MKGIAAICAVYLLFSLPLFAQDSSSLRLHQELKELNNKMDDIQKHYYEREMVETKDSYAVGLNNMNYYITIALGAVTILGVLVGIAGFKSIFDLKEKYNKELSDLKIYREASEKEFNSMKTSIETELKHSKEKIKEGLEQNKEDLNRYKREVELLQAQINIKRESNQKNYIQAVSYADQALKIFPDNLELLTAKALCLGKSKRYNEAIETVEYIIDKEINKGKSLILWVNLAEMCLLSQDRRNYRNFELILKDHEDEFQKYRPTTTAYLKAYYYFLHGKLVEFKKEIEVYISNSSLYLTVERLGSSQMDEFYAEQLNSTSPYKDIMLAFVDYLRGARSEDEMKLLIMRL